MKHFFLTHLAFLFGMAGLLAGNSADLAPAPCSSTSDQTGNWTSTTTWCDNVVPGATTNAKLGGDTVTVDANSTVNSLVINNNAVLIVPAGVIFTIKNGLTEGSGANNFDLIVYGTLVVENGSLDLNNNGSISIYGSLLVNNGNFISGNNLNVDANGSVTVNGDMDLGNNYDVNVEGDITITGDLSAGTTNTSGYGFDGSGSIYVEGNINAGASVEINPDLMLGTRWVGNTADWSTGTNWSDGVPNASDNVVIPTKPSGNNFPIANISLTLKKLIIRAEASVEMTANSSLTLTGPLTLEGDFIIRSDASGTGSFIDNGSIIYDGGQIIVERMFETASTYHLVTPVISDAASNDELAGALGAYGWTETTGQWTAVNLAANEPLEPGKGYAVKFSSANQKITYTGALNTGDINYELTFTPGVYKMGYNMIGNPFPSGLNWNSAAWAKPAEIQSNTIWYQVGNNSFATYNGNSMAGTNGGTNLIPPGQGFWIRYISGAWSNPQNTNLTLPNAARAHTSGFFKSADEGYDRIRIISSNNQTLETDEMVLVFAPEADMGYEKYDSEKMFGTSPTRMHLFTRSRDNAVLTINSFAFDEGMVVVPIGIKTGQAGSYSFKISELVGFGPNDLVYLEDLATGQFFPLTQGEYRFEATAGQNETRFNLHLVRSVVTDLEESLPAQDLGIHAYEDQILVQLGQSSQANLRIFDLAGRLVFQKNLNTENFVSLRPGLPAGAYIVRLDAPNGHLAKTIVLN